MFSKTCEYAIRAVLHIAHISEKEEKISLKQIADEIDSPLHFTGKIMQQLTKSKIVSSSKGPNGGFFLNASQLKHITLSQVVDIFDGDSVYNGCGLGLHECSDEFPCPLHEHFKSIRTSLKIMLESTTVSTLAKRLDEEEIVLKLKKG